MAFKRAMCSLPTVSRRQSAVSEIWDRVTAKVKVCGVAERSPLKVRDKRRSLNRAVLTHPDELSTHILEITTAAENFRLTRLSCNSSVSFRKQSDC